MAVRTFSVIGGGRVGTWLAAHLPDASLRLGAIVEQNAQRRDYLASLFPQNVIFASAESAPLEAADIIAICVRDDQIEAVAAGLAKTHQNLRGKIVFHTSGVYGADILQPLRESGAFLASVHPILAVSDVPPAELPLRGVFFDVEGDAEALRPLQTLLKNAGAKVISVTAEQKTALHLAAVLYSNYFVILADLAAESLRRAGLGAEFRYQPFVPLIESTLKNLAAQPPAEALTGPLKRADVSTLKKHLAFLQERFPEAAAIYRQCAEYMLTRLDMSAKEKAAVREVLRQTD